jgi:hypothetical protein
LGPKRDEVNASVEECIKNCCMICTHHQTLFGSSFQEDLMEIDRLKDLGVNGNIILKVDVQEVEWNDLAQNRDRWRALMNTIMYFRFP